MGGQLRIRFWGVRGSFPVPGPSTIRFGGNTSCVQVSRGNATLIFDAGSGLRLLGNHLGSKRRGKVAHIFFSHYHLDHMLGLPFFKPIYSSDWTLHFYGPKGETRTQKEIISSIFGRELFPVSFDDTLASIRHHELGEQKLKVSGFEVESFPLNHPGKTLGYVIRLGKKRIGYLTDSEPLARFSHLPSSEKADYHRRLLEKFSGVNVLIHDAHFSDKDYYRYRGWGHTSWGDAIRFAREAKVGCLILFHHALNQTDQSLSRAQAELKKREKGLKISFAREGQVILV